MPNSGAITCRRVWAGVEVPPYLERKGPIIQGL